MTLGRFIASRVSYAQTSVDAQDGQMETEFDRTKRTDVNATKELKNDS